MGCPPLRISAHTFRLVPVSLRLQGVPQSEDSRAKSGSLKFKAAPVLWLVLQAWHLGREGNSGPECVNVQNECASKGRVG